MKRGRLSADAAQALDSRPGRYPKNEVRAEAGGLNDRMALKVP
jgi:hypothetical protein